MTNYEFKHVGYTDENYKSWEDTVSLILDEDTVFRIILSLLKQLQLNKKEYKYILLGNISIYDDHNSAAGL